MIGDCQNFPVFFGKVSSLLGRQEMTEFAVGWDMARGGTWRGKRIGCRGRCPAAGAGAPIATAQHRRFFPKSWKGFFQKNRVIGVHWQGPPSKLGRVKGAHA
jgi:hypothetical protein